MVVCEPDTGPTQVPPLPSPLYAVAAVLYGDPVAPGAAVVGDGYGGRGRRNSGYRDGGGSPGRGGGEPGRAGCRRADAGAVGVDRAQVVAVLPAVGEAGEGVGRGGRAAVGDGRPGSPAAEVARGRGVVVDVVLVAGDGGIAGVVPGQGNFPVAGGGGQPGGGVRRIRLPETRGRTSVRRRPGTPAGPWPRPGRDARPSENALTSHP